MLVLQPHDQLQYYGIKKEEKKNETNFNIQETCLHLCDSVSIRENFINYTNFNITC